MTGAVDSDPTQKLILTSNFPLLPDGYTQRRTRAL
jgi:hypothetical protein